MTPAISFAMRLVAKFDEKCHRVGRLVVAVLLSSVIVFPMSANAADNQLVKRLRVMKKCELCDLSGADLRRLSLVRANLAGANLRGANLEGADLSRANLRGAKLIGANLKDATLVRTDFRGAHLDGSNLAGANLKSARFERAWLQKVDLRGALMQRTRFNGATLRGADLRNTNMTRANFSGVILQGVNFSSADLQGHNFSGVDLTAANFTKSDLRQANFSNAILISANLSKANLAGANFVSVNAQNANFQAVDLTGANLRQSNLNGADLSNAQLSDANLSNSELVSAKLVNANLTGANLQNAKLTGAILINARFIGSNMRNASLLSANLSKADLSNARLDSANLGAANLHEASLEGTNLARADLRFADMRNAQTLGAVFAGANLLGAKVTKEDLQYANVVEAKLDPDLMAALNPPTEKSSPKSSDSGTTSAPPKVKRQNLLPEHIEKTGLSVALIDVVTIPPSSATKPFARINWLHHAGDGSGRLFVADMRGKIHIVRDGQVVPTPFLDIASVRGDFLYHQDMENGLYTFAFHPDFARRGRPGFGKLYTAHTERGSPSPSAPLPRTFTSPIEQVKHLDVLIEWTVDPHNRDRINPGSLREVLRIQQPHKGNNMGMLAFNPVARRGSNDFGMLYIGVGDGGDTTYSGIVDAQRVGQNPETPFGSILRINPLTDGRRAYSVPFDNPFVSKPQRLPEIWAYGFRNPIRFSWDTGGTGKMIISDVGQGGIEELNLGVAGANYGWSEREGTFAVDHSDQYNLGRRPPHDKKNRFAYPVAQYDHDEGRAIIGGFVYHGARNPNLRGMYIFGDIATGRIFYVPLADLGFGRQAKISELTLYHGGQTKTLLEILDGEKRADLRFGLGEDGEIYVLTKRDGMVRTFRPVTGFQSNR